MTTPTTLVLFGATGDLAQKKIWKSLFDLHAKKVLPKNFSIIGFSRREWNDEMLHDFIAEVLKKEKNSMQDFLKNISYCKGDLFDASSYAQLADTLFARDREHSVCSNKMFFLAIPPDVYETVFTLLAQSGLSTPCAQIKNEDGVSQVPGTWTRVLVEKPFGSNSETAQKLDTTLGSLFHEDQIFRIDHYLAKDTVQNILTFRFHNNLFEPLWNNQYIEKIEIDMHEQVDVSTRGSLYDGIGTLRDVGQNHILQMLALIAMDAPEHMEEKEIRQGRINILRDVKPVTDSYVKAQYEGYRDVSGVDDKSRTETFFRIQVEIDNERWRGVPVYLESGKALPEKKTEIRIYFKGGKNILTFFIQPREGVAITLINKKAGLASENEQRELFMEFSATSNVSPDAYEKVIFDAILGDRTVFTRTEEVEAEWNVVMPFISKWANEDPIVYKKGTYPNKKAL